MEGVSCSRGSGQRATAAVTLQVREQVQDTVSARHGGRLSCHQYEEWPETLRLNPVKLRKKT